MEQAFNEDDSQDYEDDDDKKTVRKHLATI